MHSFGGQGALDSPGGEGVWEGAPASGVEVYVPPPHKMIVVCRPLRRHFMSTDARKFEEIWLMNEEEAKELVHRVSAQDRAVTEQQLGLPFTESDL